MGLQLALSTLHFLNFAFSAILFCFPLLLFPFNGILIGFFLNHYCQLLAVTALSA